MLLHPAILPWLITLAAEIPIVALVYKPQWRRMALTCACATSVTNLTMNLALFPNLSWESYLLYGEIGALAIEALVYWWVAAPRDLPKALVASALANLGSFGLGHLLFS